MISWSKCRPRGNRISFSERFGRFNFCAEGGVIAAVTATRPAFRVLLGDGLSQWIYTAAITFPFQLLALASSKEGAARTIWFLLLSKGSCYAGRCCAFRSRREP